MAVRDPARLASLRRLGLGAEADAELDRYAELVRLALDVPIGLVSLVDDTEQVFPGQVGLSEPLRSRRRTPLSHSFCQHVVEDSAPLVVIDARADERVRDNAAIVDLSVIGYAGMPLTDAAGQVLGSLCAMTPTPRNWTERELSVLAGLARACSAELRLRLSAQAQAHDRRRLALLGEVSRTLSTTMIADDVLRRLVRLVVPTLGEWAVAGAVDEAGRVSLIASAAHEGQRSGLLAELSRAQATVLDPAAASRVTLRTGEPTMLVEASRAQLLGRRTGPDEQELWDRLGASHVLVVPLTRRGAAIGYLTLGRSTQLAPFDDTDRQDAVDIGRRAGLALDNATLYEQARNTSRALQHHMLTRLPEPDHLHVVARYRPASRDAQVGGDWYDAFLQPDGATVLVVGDVTGHDIDAAAMMGQVRNLLRATVYDHDEPPSQSLVRVDRMLAGLAVATLATVVLARVEQTAQEAAAGHRRLRWSAAGHPAPVLLEPDGTARQLVGGGDLLLGLDPGTCRHDHEAVLKPGATVVFFTDGLVERRGRDIDEGVEQLLAALAGRGALPLDGLCDQVLEDMVGTGAEDDVALVAIRAYAEDRPRPADAGPQYVPGRRRGPS